ncbi:tetratricopeptide repeat protein [Nostoc sp.]|uniref:tetratricopeptide repeat protein n=1 Tax=Nostoc sp. TaxID=1180 RepID=UPI002FFCC1EC
MGKFPRLGYSFERYSEAEPLYTQALVMCDRILGVNHRTTATIQENLVILQRQSTSPAIWKRRLGQFVQILLAMSTMGYSVSQFYRFIYCSDRLNKS